MDSEYAGEASLADLKFREGALLADAECWRGWFWQVRRDGCAGTDAMKWIQWTGMKERFRSDRKRWFG